MNLVRHFAAYAVAAACTSAALAQANTPAKAAAAASAPASVHKTASPGGATLDHCEKQAGDRAGDARKAFLKSCLKPVSGQQGKMKQCNADAKGKKGDERRAFMSECLRKKKT